MLAVLALASSRLAAAPPTVAPSAALLHDETFCLGCHTAPQGASQAPQVDARALQGSAHHGLTCADCHQDVTALPHHLPAAAVSCARCHDQVSAHDGRRVAKPGRRLPGCTDCHGGHGVQAARLTRATAPDTCGRCHGQIAAAYRQSIHGQALAQGNPDVPTCTTCHPQHHGQAGPRGVRKEGVVATCASCHEDPGLQQRYAIPAGRLVSFLGSYHGAAGELGDGRAADCVSCHGVHDILPSRDPRSSINRANLPRTCGRCHPGAGARVADGPVHVQPSPRHDRILFWVRLAYQLFIVSLMSSFLGYIGFDLFARWRERRRGTPPPPHGHDEPQFERLTLNQRVQHWLLITSFVALLVTGLPLIAPASPLSRGVVHLLGGMGARAVLHRAAAMLLIGLIAYHALYVLFSRRGYWEFRQLLPRPQDALDVLAMLGYFLGLRRYPPAFDRYNYIEKFEYLAVGWGSVVMIGSGALLWAPRLSLAFLPKWLMDVALVVHSWEAILAFLAIIIWHMYNVHWNPSIFPMSRVWLTGKIGLTEFRSNHPLEYKRLAAGTEDDHEPAD